MLRNYFRLIAWLVATLLLWLPVDRALRDIGADLDRLANAGAVVALMLILAGCFHLSRSLYARVWIPVLVVALLLVRAVYYGLIQFSGSGFTEEFFVHMEWRSVVLAWREYGDLMLAAGILSLLILLGGAWLIRAGGRVRRPLAVTCLATGLAGVALVYPAMPEWQFYQAWRSWNRPLDPDLDPAMVARWRQSDLVETRLTARRDVVARPPEQPRNLVLVYLESMGSMLLDHPRWPELTPGLDELKSRYGWVDYLHASGFITIEGIANSLCGTLMPFSRGNDSLASGEALARHLPCMSDVLDQAGYEQVYMGGAGLGFAGKGKLLESHGYDRLMGIKYWREQGLDQRPGTWGLSDADLFEQALNEWASLQDAGMPFNLTLLTIGTHLPGYTYSECEPYGDGGEIFLDAVYCTDQLVARFVHAARSRGLLENTVMVITADHDVFPSPEMKRLFDQDVEKRQLPLIVLGEDLPEPATRVGAAYDLAPTVLDLLGVEHNAHFMLGRSLVRESAQREAYFSRYRDVFQGREVDYGEHCSENESVPAPPLDRCQKRELMELLYGYAAAFSEMPVSLACGWLDNTSSVSLPGDAGRPMEFLVAGSDQMGRFTHESRPVPPTAGGLFILDLARDGTVVERHYRPPDDTREWPSSFDQGIHWVAWRPEAGGDDEIPADALARLPGWRPDRPGAWLIDHGRVLKQAEPDAGNRARVLEVDARTCKRLVQQDDERAPVESG